MSEDFNDNKTIQAQSSEAISGGGSGIGADADYVRESTGFAIGGVAPLGHKNKPLYFFDNTLIDFDEVWCAAGTPSSLFKLKTKDLLKVTQAQILNII